MNTTKLAHLLGLSLLVGGVGGAGWVANHFWSTPSAVPGAASRQQSPSNPTDNDEEQGVVCKGYVDLEHGVRSLAPLRPGRVAAILVKETQHVEARTGSKCCRPDL